MASFLSERRREAAKNILSQALMLLGHSSARNRLINVFGRMAKTEHQRMIANWISHWLSQGNPGAIFLTRLLNGTHPNVRKNFLANAIVNLFFRDQKLYDRLRAEYGFNPPSVMLISPTMRCNYHCLGCYAGNYTKDDDLPPEVFDRVVTEAEAIGIKFVTILGGEPFIYRPLLDIFAAHKQVSFQVYTNGSLIDEDMAAKLVKLGNVAPQISIDGFREQTDAGRGKGAFDQAIKAMDNLRQKGCIFGFSTMVTPNNIDVITSDEFIDFIIDKGALFGWYFLHIPVGRNPSLEMMPTPEQRNKLRLAVNRFRKTKPILLVDFWNDGPLTAGCINGGRIYFHINHKGDVEPCIFIHFATDNIKQTPLVEALNSPFFRGLRKMQPFGYNTLRPCPIIDYPKVMRMALKKWGAYPTHDGAEKIFTELSDGLERYAAEVEELYKPIWEREYAWAEKWMTVIDHPPERIKTRKAGYYLSQSKRKPETLALK
ncbi:radical SAM protein [Dehalococcoidales bacterium]|nr:radical SAM protein [Dehalococcoidales bacterium]MCL0046417.1 radical SAM protein [Dehalococcoidales bacterium]